MATLTTILDVILVFFKLMGQIPDMLDKYQLYKQDTAYAGSSAKLEAALVAYIKARREKDVQAALNAAHSVATGVTKP